MLNKDVLRIQPFKRGCRRRSPHRKSKTLIYSLPGLGGLGNCKPVDLGLPARCFAEIAKSDIAVPTRTGRREWIGLAIIALPKTPGPER